MRTTKAQVKGVITELLKTAIEAGLLEQGDRVVIHEGNGNYARSWHIYVERPVPHGLAMLEFPGIDLHGCCTTTETWLNLTAALRMLQAARDWNWEPK